jgi:hypothetical protein
MKYTWRCANGVDVRGQACRRGQRSSRMVHCSRSASNDYHDEFSPSNDFSPVMTSAQHAVNA